MHCCEFFPVLVETQHEKEGMYDGASYPNHSSLQPLDSDDSEKQFFVLYRVKIKQK